MQSEQQNEGWKQRHWIKLTMCHFDVTTTTSTIENSDGKKISNSDDDRIF